MEQCALRMPWERLSKLTGKAYPHARSVSMKKHNMRNKAMEESQRSVLGKLGICLIHSHKCPLHPRKRELLMGEGVLTCGLDYSLRLPISGNHGNSGQVQISLFKGSCGVAVSLEDGTPMNDNGASGVKIAAHSCGAVMVLHHFPFRNAIDKRIDTVVASKHEPNFSKLCAIKRLSRIHSMIVCNYESL